MVLCRRFIALSLISVLILKIECDVSDNSVTSSDDLIEQVISSSVGKCNLPKKLATEIAGYAPIIQRIVNTALNGSFKGVTYDELSIFVDKFGNRFAGTENLENAIDYMINKSIAKGLENVHGEETPIPHWVRGSESATLFQPLKKNLAMLGLGWSVGTPPEGISAEALVVRSFDELQEKRSQAKGKIVVYNQDYISYGASVQYRGRGASEASKVGAVASLIRSITPFSINSPHTGMQTYSDNVTKIPTACITVEDAHLLQRLQDEGETIKILLKMEAQTLPDVTSRNVVSEIKGSQYPEKIVIVSGHIDSWDVGNGAMDDGGGFMISWGALALLKSLDLRPKRTIRAIFWTGEEFGYVGAFHYAKDHANETDNFIFMMESDSGTFDPVGLEYSAGPAGACIVQEVAKLLAPLNATRTRQSPNVGSDIEIWTSKGIPGASLDNKNDKYFWYHHSQGDTLDVENTDSLDKNTALWASVAYVMADLSIDFPRENSKKQL